jgi:hypothetical protein
MRRLLLCLPLCFVLAPDCPSPPAGFDSVPPPTWHQLLSDAQVPTKAQMEQLARTNPVAFLENCLRKSDRDVKGYRGVLDKQERIKNTLYPPELIDFDFREDPFSFRMVWKEGLRRVRKSLYVRGENGGKLVVRPDGRLASWLVLSLDANGAEVRDSSRYPPEEFGMKISTEKTLAAWKNARDHRDLHLTFLGEQRVKEAGDRMCWVFERTGYVRLEEDGITRSQFYFDTETWLQVGTILWRKDELLGKFFFRDIQLNPEFPPDTFTPQGI